jgi:crossover junction endodeoxyribonuclease RusA
MILRLPFPPSMNHYWRNVGARVLISKAGRLYRVAVAQAFMLQNIGMAHEPYMGRIALTIHTYAPDARARDLDNVCKAVLDALQESHVYKNDSQIDDLHIIRGAKVCKPGFIMVSIQPLERQSFGEEDTSLRRCPARMPHSFPLYEPQPSQPGGQCGLPVGHAGEHTLLIPTGMPWLIGGASRLKERL